MKRLLPPALIAFVLTSGLREVHSFVLESSHWPSGSKVVMQLNLGTPAGPLQDGFATWNASATDALAIWNGYLDLITVSGVVNPSVSEAAADGVNAVAFSSTIFGESFGTGTLAVTVIQTKPSMASVTTEADVLVNSAYQFDSYRGAKQGTLYDLHRVLLHEFGHVLGLDHNDAPPLGTKLMESIISDFDHPAADDIAGIRSLYGVGFSYQQSPLTLRQAVPFAYNIGAPSDDVISYTASGLPPGLIVDPKTGSISGAPTQSGVFASVITAVGPIANAYLALPLTVKGFEDVPGLLGIVPWSSAPLVADPVRPRLYACGNAGVDIIDTDTLKVTSLYAGGEAYSGTVSADASNLYFLEATANGPQIKKIDLTTLKLLPSINLDSSIQTSGNFVDGLDGRGYIGSTTGIVQFDLATGARLADFGYELGYNGYHQLSISPDRKTLYASEIDHGTFSYDVSTPQPVLLHSGAALADLNPSPDGQYLYGIKTLATGWKISRTVLPSLVPTTYSDLPNVRDLAVGPDGTVYSTTNPTPPASGFVGVYDPVSLQQTAKVDLFGSGVSQDLGDAHYPTYYCESAVPDGSGRYFFTDVLYQDQFNTDSELWKFSTDLASFPASPPATKNLLNVSTRTIDRNGDDSMIGGFIVQGPVPKKILIRAIGPSLPVTGAMDNPVLDLYNSSGQLLKSNDNWISDRLNVVGTGLAPASERESAIATTLAPGAYTAVVHDSRQQPGLALVEVYDLDPDHSLLANISTRGRVETGNNVMIGGFIVGAAAPTRVLVRAIGPSLTKQGVPAPLADPILELHDGKGKLVSTNDNWRSTQEAAILATGLAPSNDKESVILTTLAPGNYTAIVRGQGVTTGVALVEIYNLDSVSN